ncbi:MAG: glycosyltransferase [Anaerolineales bacterium]|nr:glycosyltransferase [Anaerolineales bacterium]
MTIHLIIALLWMGVMIALYWLIRDRYRSLGKLKARSRHPEPTPSVTVIIPARDEEANIEACLKGLLTQDYPRGSLDILAVDDNSSDDTPAIVERLAASEPRLDLLQAPPLPPGWRGKQNACWHGAQHAQGDWLCFTDADTRAESALIATAIAETQKHQLDLLSLHPHQVMKSFWERLLMPVPFLTLMMLLDARRINDPSDRAAMANGQFILLHRAVYNEVDGHRSVRAAVLEDVEIAKRVKRAGFRIAIRGGGDLIRTRMYRDLSTLWNALARNGSELFGPTLTALAVLNAFFAAVFPWGYPLWLAVRLGSENTWIAVAALSAAAIGSAAWYAMHAMALRIHNVPLTYLLLLPITDFLMGVVNLDGLVQRLRGRRTWKGRPI